MKKILIWIVLGLLGARPGWAEDLDCLKDLDPGNLIVWIGPKAQLVVFQGAAHGLEEVKLLGRLKLSRKRPRFDYEVVSVENRLESIFTGTKDPFIREAALRALSSFALRNSLDHQNFAVMDFLARVGMDPNQEFPEEISSLLLDFLKLPAEAGSAVQKRALSRKDYPVAVRRAALEKILAKEQKIAETDFGRVLQTLALDPKEDFSLRDACAKALGLRPVAALDEASSSLEKLQALFFNRAHHVALTQQDIELIRELGSLSFSETEASRVAYQLGDLIRFIKDPAALAAAYAVVLRLDQEFPGTRGKFTRSTFLWGLKKFGQIPSQKPRPISLSDGALFRAVFEIIETEGDFDLLSGVLKNPGIPLEFRAKVIRSLRRAYNATERNPWDFVEKFYPMIEEISHQEGEADEVINAAEEAMEWLHPLWIQRPDPWGEVD